MRGVNILPNDRILSWDLDGTICIWDLQTRMTISVFKLGTNDNPELLILKNLLVIRQFGLDLKVRIMTLYSGIQN